MNAKIVKDIISGAASLADQSLAKVKALKAQYPYFHTAYLLWSRKAAMDEDTDFQEIIGESATFTADRSVLAKFVGEDLGLRTPYSSNTFVENFPKGPILDTTMPDPEQQAHKKENKGTKEESPAGREFEFLKDLDTPKTEKLEDLVEIIKSESTQAIRSNVDQDLNQLRMEEEEKRSQKLAELQSQKDALRDLKLKLQQYSASRELKKQKEAEVKRNLTDEADLDRSVTQLIRKYGKKPGKASSAQPEQDQKLPDLRESPLFSPQNENIRQIEEYMHDYDVPKEDHAIPTSAEFDSEEINQVSETMAKVYIDQGKYEKAIGVYKQLKLKYPEKFVYFAQQIRVLTEKL